MCRYSVVAHSYGAYTVRQEGSGDILTFEFGSYLEAKQAQADARRVAAELERAYNSGLERGAREQRDYSSPMPEVHYTTDDTGGIHWIINGVVSQERYANRVSAQFAARREVRGEA